MLFAFFVVNDAFMWLKNDFIVYYKLPCSNCTHELKFGVSLKKNEKERERKKKEEMLQLLTGQLKIISWFIVSKYTT